MTKDYLATLEVDASPAARLKIEEAEDAMTHAGAQLVLPMGFGPVPKDSAKVFFFDIDNCLYHASHRIHELMQKYIRKYIEQKLHVGPEEAKDLNVKYYREYGLAIQGLVHLHKLDAMDYNLQVDDSLPLHEILKPDMALREMLVKLRQCGKIDRFWLFTNAYKNHGLRVVRLLGVADLFDGMTYCDYSKQDKFICKPDPRAFHKALDDAGVTDCANAYFVDDSFKNCATALSLGFAGVVNVVETDEQAQNVPAGAKQIRTIHDLPHALPELFR